jgi:tetratricopeptide (TPR) repeat protein
MWTLGTTVALAVPSVAPGGSARADTLPAAVELVREAHAHEAAHEDDLALRRYAEALSLDPTLEGAYLGLGALRQKLGDPREAERVYATALSRLPELWPALLGRAKARRALGELPAADADLETYVEATGDVAAMRLLAGWYAEEGRPLAQLAAWRKVLTCSERGGDDRERKEARLTVHALELMVGTADPVRAPSEQASSVRRGIARMEKRR